MSYLVCADMSGCRVAIATYQLQHSAYKKTAPEDGLIQSKTCRVHIENKV